jgi:hypothetical protein
LKGRNGNYYAARLADGEADLVQAGTPVGVERERVAVEVRSLES